MYDAIIVGAGPGGSTAATCMKRAGLHVLLLDKDAFPRDKICGDAISGKSVDVLKRLDILDRLNPKETLGSWGVIFSGPRGDEVAIPFTKAMNQPVAPGYVSKRIVYDETLFRIAQEAGAETMEGASVKGLLRDNGHVRGVRIQRRDRTQIELEAPLVIGADGAYSVVARELGMQQLFEDHYCGGLRSYYEGVTGFHEYNFIELHFVEESIPGYFWIFPMSNGMANVGIGMLSSSIKRKKVKLKSVLEACLRNPKFAPRFENARRVGNVVGWGLPLGSRPRKMYGDGWMLLGDAASLIDPFTGEGIGNAMVSAEFASQFAVDGKARGEYSEAFLKGYQDAVLGALGSELKLSRHMQQLGRWQWLLNLVIRKASRSPEVADTISSMFDDQNQRKKLISPAFYLRVLMA